MMPAPRKQDPRPLPHNVEVEQALLGALLINNDAVLYAEGLRQDHFFEPLHAKIFCEILRQIGLGQAVSPLTVKSAFPTDIQVVGELTIPRYLARLAAEATTVINVRDYAKFIIDFWELRQIVLLGEDICDSSEKYSPPDELVVVTRARIDEIRAGGTSLTREPARPLGAATTGVIERMQDIMRSGVSATGIITGLAPLDRILGGLQLADLVIGAGRPGMGKTTFAGSIARAVAKTGEHGVGFFSLEMPERHIGARFLADEAFTERDPIHYTSIVRGDLGGDRATQDARHERLVSATRNLNNYPLILDCSSGLTVGDVYARTRAMAAKLEKQYKRRLSLLVVDYLKFVRPSDRYRGQRVQEVGEITAAFKTLAKDLNICVLLLSQLSRAVESRQDKRPELADLRDCLAGDSLVADADTGERIPIREIADGALRFNVWSLDSDLKLRKRKITEAWAVKSQPVYRVLTRLGRETKCSGGHRFYTSSGWCEVRDLRLNELIALPRVLAEPLTPPSMSAAQACILGWLLGDGYLGGSAALTVATKNEAVVAAAMAREAFPDLKPYWKPERGNTPAQRVLLTTGRLCGAGNNSATTWLRKLGVWGKRGADKSVPQEVFRQSNNIVAAFLRGLFHADGCIVGGAKEVKLVSISKRLVYDAQNLLLRLGINASVRPGPHKASGFRTSTSTIWTLAISGRTAITAFMAQVGFIAEKHCAAVARLPVDAKRGDAGKVDRLPPAVSKIVSDLKTQQKLSHKALGWRDQGKLMSRSTAGALALKLEDPILATFADSDVIWDEVKSIDFAGEEMTYDLTVTDLHNFVVDGFVTHNSGEIEQDADVVIFLYREAYYLANHPKITTDPVLQEKLSQCANKLELIVAKNRMGPTGTAEVFCSMAASAVRTMDRSDNFYGEPPPQLDF